MLVVPRRPRRASTNILTLSNDYLLASFLLFLYMYTFRRNWFSRDEINNRMNDVLDRYNLKPLKGRDFYNIFHHYWRFRAPQAVKELLQGLEVSVGTLVWGVVNR